MSTAMMTRPALASTATEEDLWIELDPWIDPEDVISADSVGCVGATAAYRSVVGHGEFIELEPPTIVGSQDEMRFGLQTYTPEQARVIELAVRRRRPLSIPPLPIDD